jgi:hypothetical protein
VRSEERAVARGDGGRVLRSTARIANDRSNDKPTVRIVRQPLERRIDR